MANNWKVENGKLQVHHGFTLIELLIVLAILGVLSSIVLVSFRSSQTRGSDAGRKSDLKQVATALELFYSDYGKYPASNATGQILACPYTHTTSSGTPCTWGGSIAFWDNKTTYMKAVPKDPDSSYSYRYRVDSTGQKFQLFAHLGNTRDINLIAPPLSPILYCGGTNICNFAVTSPNTTPAESL